MSMPPLWIGAQRWVLARLIGNGLLQATSAVILAGLIRRVVDDLLLRDPAVSAALEPRSVGNHFGAAIGVVAIVAFLRWRERVDREILAQTYVHQLRKAMYSKLGETPAAELNRKSRGGILLRFLGDLTAISQWVSMGFARLGVAAVTITVALAALALRDPMLVLVVGAILAGGAGAMLALGRSMDAAVYLTRRRRTYLANNITEKMMALPVVQAFGRRRHEQRRLQRQSGRLRDALIDRARSIGRIGAIADATGTLAMLGALLFGVFAVGDRSATPGSVVALMAVVGLLAAPTRDLGKVYEYWRRGRISRAKIEAFLEDAQAIARVRPPRLAPGPGRLELIDVDLHAGEKGISAVAEPGARIIISGSAGAGKSNLLQIAGGLLTPKQGQVLLDGQDLAAVRRDSIPRAIGIVSPDLPLVRGTVEDNIRFARPAARAKQMSRIIDLCGLDALASALPQGLATRVTEGGRSLSAGQRQRIALARALLPRPRVLLLDDLDAGLDNAMRKTLCRVLAEFKGTVLMVTRDVELRGMADACWMLKGHRLEVVSRTGSAPQASGNRKGQKVIAL